MAHILDPNNPWQVDADLAVKHLGVIFLSNKYKNAGFRLKMYQGCPVVGRGYLIPFGTLPLQTHALWPSVSSMLCRHTFYWKNGPRNFLSPSVPSVRMRSTSVLIWQTSWPHHPRLQLTLVQPWKINISSTAEIWTWPPWRCLQVACWPHGTSSSPLQTDQQDRDWMLETADSYTAHLHVCTETTRLLGNA